MVADGETLGHFLGSRRQYLFPPFGRGFRWNKEQWEAWIYAFKQSGKAAAQPLSTRANKFVGTVLLIAAPDGQSGVVDFLVLDGKQRLITTMLLLKALSDAVRPHTLELDANSAHLLQFVFNPCSSPSLRFKVVPKQKDRDVFGRLIEGKATEGDYKSPMGKALGYFESRLASLEPKDLDTLVKGFFNASILCVMLDPKTDDIPEVIQRFW